MQVCCAQRIHIVYCVKNGKSQNETFRLLQEVYGQDALSVSTCRRWYLRAQQGDHSGKDLPQPGKRPTATNLNKVCQVEEVLQQDRHATVHQVAAEVQISTGSAHNILRNELELRKKALKFVPRVLNQEQKDLCIRLCHENLRQCEDPLFLWGIIMGDESWFSILKPEQKQHSMQWMEKGSRHKKALWSRQARKMLMEIFFDDQGIVHLEFLPPKMTVTSHVYVGILARLREAIQRKRPVLWQDNSFRILHDNAPGHKANHTVTAMMETDMKEVSHPRIHLTWLRLISGSFLSSKERSEAASLDP